MTATIYLHIGAPKTGTSYLQSLCSQNRDRLAAEGILWPGQTWYDQARAVRELTGARPHSHPQPEIDGAWERLTGEIRRWDGHAAIVSMEWLVSARPRHIRRAVKTLAPADVQVILTGRDIARTIPAQWQASVQNRATWTWREYLAAAADPSGAEIAAGRRLWRQHDLGRILGTWSEVVPVANMHLITVPPPGSDPELLWHRFAGVIGLDVSGYDTTPPNGNPSLGAASAEVVRRVNVAARERDLPLAAHQEMIRRTLAKDVLLPRRDSESALGLPAEYHSWAVQQGERIAAEVARSGAHVVGDLGELVPDPARIRQGRDPDQLRDGELLATTIDGTAGLAGHVHELLTDSRGECEQATAERDQAIRERDQVTDERDAARHTLDAHRNLSPSERVKRCVVELSRQLRWLGSLRAMYRRARSLVKVR